MSDFKYSEQDKKDVVELLRGIAADLETPKQMFTHDQIRLLTYGLMTRILGDIRLDMVEYMEEVEVSIGWNREIELDGPDLDLTEFDDQFADNIFNIPDGMIDEAIAALNLQD